MEEGETRWAGCGDLGCHEEPPRTVMVSLEWTAGGWWESCLRLGTYLSGREPSGLPPGHRNHPSAPRDISEDKWRLGSGVCEN